MSESIRCRACDTVMVTDYCESERSTTTCWHSCARCGQQRMTSEPGLYVAAGAQKNSVVTEAEAGLSSQGRALFVL